MASKVHLWDAWEWICENCGRNNFASAVTVEITPEERIECAEANGVDPESMQCQLISQPEEVTCSFCGTEYETETPDGV